MSNIPEEAVSMMIREANRNGLLGKKVKIWWLPPSSGTEDFRGSMVVEDITPTSGTGEWP
jgi:hypothetical protein